MSRAPQRRAARRLLRSEGGLAAVEFALCLPMLLLLYLGGFEAADAVATYRKLADTTVTLASLAAQYQSMSASDVQTVFNASAQVMTPSSTSALGIVLSEVSTDAQGRATVTWSQAYNGATPLTVGSAASLPSGLGQPSTSYIQVKTTYQFALVDGFAFSHALGMSDSIYMLPRSSRSIPYTG